MLTITKTELADVLLITPATIFTDFRGTYVETYNEQLYRDAGIDQRFVQDDISVSTQHVLRGIHGDRKTWKLISCLYGKIYVVVVNCIDDSPQFGRWQGFELSDQNRLQLLVPPSHGVAHLALSATEIFHYKQTTYYDRAAQFTYRWDDPRFGIVWPIQHPILSERDKGSTP